MSYNDQNIFSKILSGDAECVKVLENDFILAFMEIGRASCRERV